MRVLRDHETVKLPERKSTTAAAFDIYVPETTTVEPDSVTMIPHGVKVEIPRGYFGLIKERSSLAARGLHVVAGVIDSDYRGEIMVLLRNTTSEEYIAEKDDRVAQLILIPQYRHSAVEVEELTSTDRGAGGFGSTGQ